MERMSYEEFKKEVEAEVKDYLPDEYKDAKVTIATVSKIGQTYDSLTVRPEGQVASPAANLNAFFEDYENGKPFGRVMDNIADVIQMPAPTQLNDLNWLTDYEKAKDRLFIRVCNAETNPELIEKAPHKIVEDLAVTYHIAVDLSDQGMSSATIDYNLMEHFGITPEKLHEDAMKSSPLVLPAKTETMFNVMGALMPEAVIEDMAEDGFPGSNMIVVSNEKMCNGAGAIFYPDVLDEVAEKLGGEVVVLPSSTNECIVIPAKGSLIHSLEDLENMVKEVNLMCVDPREQLSDHVYHYDTKDKLFERSDTYKARLAEKEQKRTDRDAR